jgi:hypothetical protein
MRDPFLSAPVVQPTSSTSLAIALHESFSSLLVTIWLNAVTQYGKPQ